MVFAENLPLNLDRPLEDLESSLVVALLSKDDGQVSQGGGDRQGVGARVRLQDGQRLLRELPSLLVSPREAVDLGQAGQASRDRGVIGFQ